MKDEDLNGVGDNYNHYSISPYRLMRNYQMPVVKRKVFTESKNLYAISAGEEVEQVMKYMKDSGYDIDMIWKDLLRKADLYDIKQNLNLNYILPFTNCEHERFAIKDKVVVIAHITYESLVDECMDYIKNIPEEIDVWITSYKESILQEINYYKKDMQRNNLYTQRLENRGRDVGAIFVGCRKIVERYEYICFVHDKRTSGLNGSYPIGASFQHLVWENMLKSKDYIGNILQLFEREKRLGVLSPPKPLHSWYRRVYMDEWTVNYKNCCALAERIGLSIKLEREKPPFALSTCFWCRREALQKLWSMPLRSEDFPEEPVPTDGELNHAIERILIYVAQEAGFYSGIVENTEYAALDLQNREIWIKAAENEKRKISTPQKAAEIGCYIGQNPEKNYYIYGAGEVAGKVKQIMDVVGMEVKGYIVSDDHISDHNSCLSPRIRLCDVSPTGENVIIVGLSVVNTTEVAPILRKKKYKNVIFYNQPREKKR